MPKSEDETKRAIDSAEGLMHTAAQEMQREGGSKYQTGSGVERARKTMQGAAEVAMEMRLKRLNPGRYGTYATNKGQK